MNVGRTGSEGKKLNFGRERQDQKRVSIWEFSHSSKFDHRSPDLLYSFHYGIFAVLGMMGAQRRPRSDLEVSVLGRSRLLEMFVSPEIKKRDLALFRC